MLEEYFGIMLKYLWMVNNCCVLPNSSYLKLTKVSMPFFESYAKKRDIGNKINLRVHQEKILTNSFQSLNKAFHAGLK